MIAPNAALFGIATLAAHPSGAATGLRFDGFWPLWQILLVGVCGIALAAFSYHANTRAAARARMGLAGLRGLTVAVVMLCIAKPVLTYSEPLVEKGLAYIALDKSASLLFQDGPGGQTRDQAVVQFLKDNAADLRRLGRRVDLRYIAFDGEARSIRIRDFTVPADGKTTSLAAPLEMILREGGVHIAGAILFSDGRVTSGPDAVPFAERLGRRGVPVHTVLVGREAASTALRDVAVRDLRVPEKSFVRAKVRMDAEIGSILPSATRIEARLLIDDEPVQRKTVAVEAGRQTASVSFEYLPETVGVHRVTIALDPVQDETNFNNNRMSAFFRVYESRLNVWYLEGAVRWEQKFVRRSLEGAPNLAITTALRRPPPQETGDAQRLAPLLARSKAHLPVTDAQWASTRLLILGDIPAQRLREAEQERIRKFVQDGGGLLVIGGRENLGPGGYGASALGEVLPVRVTSTDGWIAGNLDARPTQAGRGHPAVRLDVDPIDNLRIWKSLPELRGVASVDEVKPAAEVLLTAGPDRPLLVVHRYGKGRAAVFLADGTWRWTFAERSRRTAHRRFWRQLAVWLTRSNYRQSGRRVWADTDRKTYRTGDEVVLMAHVAAPEPGADHDRRALDRSEVIARVTGPDGERPPRRLGRGPGDHEIRYRAGKAGDFQVVVQVVGPEGRVLGEDKDTQYHVEPLDLESDNPTADPERLKRIAAASGGKALRIESAGTALKELLNKNVRTEKWIERVEEVWNRPFWLVLFVGLLTAEWVLRRRWGLA